LTENQPKPSPVLSEVRDSTYQTKDLESKSFSEAPRSPLKPLSGSQQHNIQIKKKPKIG